MATLMVEIVTPEAALWVGEARALMARSSDGEFTILPQHTATVGDVVAGVVRVDTLDQGELAFVVHGGFFQVGPGEPGVTLATILAGVAEGVTQIDVARAEAARERALAALAEETRGDAGDHPAHLWAHAALERAERRLGAARG